MMKALKAILVALLLAAPAAAQVGICTNDVWTKRGAPTGMFCIGGSNDGVACTGSVDCPNGSCGEVATHAEIDDNFDNIGESCSASLQTWPDDGTVLPLTAPLEIDDTITEGGYTGGSPFPFYSSLQVLTSLEPAIAGTTSETHSGMQVKTEIPDGANSLELVYGTAFSIFNRQDDPGSTDVTEMWGLLAEAGNPGGGDTNGINGAYYLAQKWGTGSTGVLRGGKMWSFSWDGNVDTHYALETNAYQSGGTAAEVAGAWIGAQKDGGTTADIVAGIIPWSGVYAGSVTDLYGIRLQWVDILGGTATNRYGLYIDPLSGAASANDYAIYSLATQPSRLEGSLHLGGVLALEPTPAAPTCGPTEEGHIYSDSSPGKALCWCDGSNWLVVIGLGSCS